MVVNDQSNTKKSRVITYIDGFNLYFGLRERNWRKYLWLDFNIATQLICDAFHDRFDTALIVSGDADLVPPIEAVKLWEFSQALLLRHQALQQVKYFTSRVRSNVGKQERQSAYLDALTTLENVSIYWGRFQPDEKRCQKCGHYAYHPQEKKTDVRTVSKKTYCCGVPA